MAHKGRSNTALDRASLAVNNRRPAAIRTRPGRIRFEVSYRWGTRYCGKLRAALRELGFVTGTDLLVEGSDNDGFLLAENRQALVTGQAAIRTMTDAAETDDVLTRLHAIGVYEFFQ